MAIGRTNSTIGETLSAYTGLLRFSSTPTTLPSVTNKSWIPIVPILIGVLLTV